MARVVEMAIVAEAAAEMLAEMLARPVTTVTTGHRGPWQASPGALSREPDPARPGRARNHKPRHTVVPIRERVR